MPHSVLGPVETTTSIRLGAEGPLILHELEDLRVCDHINERGDWHLFAILDSRDLRPPADPDACPRPGR
jgi:hypothetical protein